VPQIISNPRSKPSEILKYFLAQKGQKHLKVIPCDIYVTAIDLEKKKKKKNGRAKSWGREERALLVPRISRGQFFLAVSFRVTQRRTKQKREYL